MEHILMGIIGILCIGLGILNRKGNIESLHSYHTRRVSEEDRIPFGKLVGLGMIIIGVAAILNAVLGYVSGAFNLSILATLGEYILNIGFLAGLGFNLYALKKYNKGIF